MAAELAIQIPDSVLPWHQESWARFCRGLAAGQVAHAVLLAGPRGTGKKQFADRAAALLLCQSPVPFKAEPGGVTVGERACGECKQCRLIAAGSHPDLQRLAPEDSKVIKIDQVRRLNDFVVRSPQVARRKVAVIDSADRLNLNAANALLKTLEEPAEDVVLLLLHHAGEPILPTIRSRCQAQRLPVPSAAAALAWLEQVTAGQFDAGSLANALERAHGAPLAAIGMLRDGLLAAGDACLEGLRRFLKGEWHLAEAAVPFTRLGLEGSLDLLSHWAVAAMKLALGHAPAGQGEAGDMLAYLARVNPAERFTGILDQITDARRQQVYNLSAELAISDILLSWKALMPRRKRPTAAKIS